MSHKKNYKRKIRISKDISKSFWDNTDNNQLKYDILKTYINCLRGIGYCDYQMSHNDYDKLSEMNWKEMALYNCDVPTSELRLAVSYYLGIGLYEGYKTYIRPIDIKYQRDYKLNIQSIP